MIARVLSQLWGVLLLLIAWQAWVSLGDYNTIVMPPPLAVFADLVTTPGAYFVPTAATLAVAAGGLLAGMVLGTVLALLVWSSRLLSGMLSPLALVFSAIPVVCMIPVLARLFGYDQKTVLAIVMVITFFPTVVFCSAGLRAVPPGSEDVFRVFGSSRWTRLIRLAMPSAVPNLMIALRITAGQSIIAAMIAEFLMGTSGLGHLFAVTHADFHMERAIGASVVAITLSTLIYVATAVAERWARAAMTE